jgi:hypothetical protein
MEEKKISDDTAAALSPSPTLFIWRVRRARTQQQRCQQ